MKGSSWYVRTRPALNYAMFRKLGIFSATQMYVMRLYHMKSNLLKTPIDQIFNIEWNILIIYIVCGCIFNRLIFKQANMSLILWSGIINISFSWLTYIPKHLEKQYSGEQSNLRLLLHQAQFVSPEKVTRT